MTKPSSPPSAAAGEVVEIDAMDGMEWEQGQRTPQASDANLAALVKKTASPPEPAEPGASRKTPVQPRPRVAVPAVPQRPRAGDPSTKPSPRAAAPGDHGGQVAQVGRAAPLRHATHLGPAVGPAPGRRLTPAPAGVSRAGSPALEIATPVAGLPALPPPGELALSSTSMQPVGLATPAAGGAGMEAFGPTKEYGLSSIAGETSGPTREYPRPGPDPQASPSFDDVTAGGPRRVDAAPASPRSPHSLDDVQRPPARAASPGASRSFDDVRTPASSGAPHSLNDILRAPARAAGAAAPVVLPLRAPAETAPNPTLREVPPTPPDDPATGASGALGSAAWRKLLFVIGGTAGVAVLVIAFVVMSGRPTAEPPRASPAADLSEAPTVPAPAVATAPVKPAAPAPRPTGAPPPPRAAAPIEPEPEPPARRVSLALGSEPAPHATPTVTPPARRAGKKHGSKQLVVDYSAQAGETAIPGIVAKEAEDPDIGLARTAYLNGNQLLFAGNAEAAIRAYRESLRLYAGYVGGYRGMGLAYGQLGDSPNALEAFKMYVTLVPNARDVALIKKRIARLQGK